MAREAVRHPYPYLDTPEKRHIMTRKWLTVSDDPSHKPIIGRWADISDSGFVDGETPLEDYAFWLITDTKISKEKAWDKWREELEGPQSPLERF